MPVAVARGVAMLAAVLAGSVLLGQQPAAAQLAGDRAARLKSCFDVFAKAVAPYRGGEVAVLDPAVAEKLAEVYNDVLVDSFCARYPEIVAAADQSMATAAQESESVRAATATDDSDFDEEYQRDSSRANLYKPHEAEYNKGDYSSSWTTLEIGGIVDSGDTKNRPSSGGRARTLNAERSFAIMAPVAKATCDLLDCQPVEIPLPGPGCFLNPGKFVAKACYIAHEVFLFAQQIAARDAEAIDWVLNCINSAQLQATHENTKKNMDNQKILWGYTQQRKTEFSDSLKAKFALFHKRGCKLETDIAYLQREFNYLRKLMLTPDAQKPGWDCSTLNAYRSRYKTCVEPCPLIAPTTGCTLSTINYASPVLAPSTSLASCTYA